jgi:hypothetical protein
METLVIGDTFLGSFVGALVIPKATLEGFSTFWERSGSPGDAKDSSAGSPAGGPGGTQQCLGTPWP